MPSMYFNGSFLFAGIEMNYEFQKKIIENLLFFHFNSFCVNEKLQNDLDSHQSIHNGLFIQI